MQPAPPVPPPVARKSDERIHPITWIAISSAIGVLAALLTFFVFLVLSTRQPSEIDSHTDGVESNLAQGNQSAGEWWQTDRPVTASELSSLLDSASPDKLPTVASPGKTLRPEPLVRTVDSVALHETVPRTAVTEVVGQSAKEVTNERIGSDGKRVAELEELVGNLKERIRELEERERQAKAAKAEVVTKLTDKIKKLEEAQRLAALKGPALAKPAAPRMAARDARVAAGPERSTYLGLGGGHWVKRNIDGGTFILLEDRSLWEIDGFDKLDAMLWLPLSNITVTASTSGSPGYGYLLINTDDGEKAHAKYIGRE